MAILLQSWSNFTITLTVVTRIFIYIHIWIYPLSLSRIFSRRLSDFLVDCAERIIALGKIHRRILNRFYAFCLWLGIPLHRVQATKPNELFKIISEFALEYRTTRERVIQQLEKKASHRERNKTRGKMITEVSIILYFDEIRYDQ